MRTSRNQTGGNRISPSSHSRGMVALPILLLIVMILGFVVAILMGRAIATDQTKLLAGFIGGAAIIGICLKLDTNVWLLIPICWLLTGRISLLPLPLSVRDLAVLLALTVFIANHVFKRSTPIAKSKALDFIMWVNWVYLVTVYIRNPVGTQAFGSEMVGGRPYVDIMTALTAYWVIQHVSLTPKWTRRLPFAMSIGAGVVSVLGLLTQKIPSLVPIIAPLYSGITVDTYLKQQNGADTSANQDDYRLGALQTFGQVAGTALVSYFPPIRLLLFNPPLRGMLYYCCVAAILLAGFRSGFVIFVIFSLLSSYFYNGIKDVARLGILVTIGIVGIVLLQSAGGNVHPAIQRALSFLPGDWDPRIVEAAEGSTEWRLQLWKIALEGDKYIKNKVLGDGFGFSAYELQIQLASMWGGTGYLNANEAESQLVTGAYHSGPISAIRYVGVVGLILFTILLVGSAFYAWKLVIRAKGTEVFPLALFIALPAIYKPIEYWFVFGGLDSDYPKAIFSLAMLNLVDRTLSPRKPSANQATLPQETAIDAPATQSREIPLAQRKNFMTQRRP